MARKLSDDAVAALRTRAAAGEATTTLAAEFKISRQHASRLIRGEQRAALGTPDAPIDGPVSAALRELLGGLELDANTRVLGEAALAVARKLDAASTSDAVAAAQAAPPLARQLADLLQALPAGPDGVGRALGALDQKRGRR